jgi:hypothetical protein
VREVASIQAGNVSVKFTVPQDMEMGIYAFRIQNAAGWSKTVLLNRPTIWWIQGNQGDSATSDGWVRIFGKNLAAKSSPVAKVGLRGFLGTHVVEAKDASPYSLCVELSKMGRTLGERDYAVRVHAGIGGGKGWSLPASFPVRKSKPWPETRLNVLDFGADSTGRTDSTPAIRAAFEKAAKGGVIFFPRGRYLVTETLQVPRFTTLRGEGRQLTCLFWPDQEQPLKELIKGTNSFAIEDMTLYCSNYIHFIAADQNLPDAGDVHIRRVCIRADMYRGHLKPEEVDARFRAALKNSTGGGDLLRLGGRNVEVTDSDLYASGRSIFLDRVKCARIANNTIYNGRWGWYCFMGTDGLIFENNTLCGADLMSTGGGLANYATPYSRYIYFGHNTFKNMFGWDREAITSDAGGGAYYGRVASAGPSSLVLEGEPSWGKREWVGAGVFIVAGRGQGQWREVVRYEKQKVELDRPWDVSPDATSLVEITMQHRHYLMIGNEFFDAGIGVQFYGTSIEDIVAGNKTTRAGGFNNIGKQYGGYHIPPEKSPCHQPSWYVQYFDNEILEGNMYRGHANNAVSSGDSHIGVFGWPPKPDWPWPFNIATMVRRNTLHNNAKIHLGTSTNPQFPSVADCIVENNIVRDSDVGIQVDAGTTGVFLRKNIFERVKNPLAGGGIARAGVHPADRALGRLQGIWCIVGDKAGKEPPAEWANAEKELQALCAKPWDGPALAGDVKKAMDDALGSLSRACPGAHTPEFMESVLGLKLELAKEDRLGALLESGTGGAADLVVKVSLADGYPEANVSVKVSLPEGWGCEKPTSGPAPVSPVEATKTFTFPIKVPTGTWGVHTLKAEVEAASGAARFRGTFGLPVGGAFVRQWLVIGPFPNKSKQALDTAIHPPEDGLDLAATYPGIAGQVKWQSAVLTGNCLDFGRIMKPPPQADAPLAQNQDATAYALACIVADEEMPMPFGLGCDDGGKLWVNGEEAIIRTQGGRAQPRQARAKAQLVKGENVIFCKVSNTTGSWQLYLSLEGDAEALKKLHVVPAQEIASLKVFTELSTKRGLSATVPGGPFAYEGEIEWKPVFEDDFSRLTLGSQWKTLRGSWAIVSGKLVTKQTGIIAILKPVKPPLRIEFDARSENPGDLTAFWGTVDKGYEGGYFIGFGSNNNSLNKILRYGQQVAQASTVLITKGKMHHIVAQVIAPPGQPATVELLVDGKLAIRYKDPQPVTDADTPGLIAWSEGEFDNVRVFQGETAKAK